MSKRIVTSLVSVVIAVVLSVFGCHDEQTSAKPPTLTVETLPKDMTPESRAQVAAALEQQDAVRDMNKQMSRH